MHSIDALKNANRSADDVKPPRMSADDYASQLTAPAIMADEKTDSFTDTAGMGNVIDNVAPTGNELTNDDTRAAG